MTMCVKNYFLNFFRGKNLPLSPPPQGKNREKIFFPFRSGSLIYRRVDHPYHFEWHYFQLLILPNTKLIWAKNGGQAPNLDGRHLEYFKFLNDARVASLGF